MSISGSGDYEIVQRQGIISLGTNVWFRSETLIRDLKGKLVAELENQDQKEAVENSFEKMQAIAHSLLSDTKYLKCEYPDLYRDYLEDLKNVLKMIYKSVPFTPRALASVRERAGSRRAHEQSEEDPPDDIDFLKWNFYLYLMAKTDRRIRQKYVPITQVVRFLRNVEEHADQRIDQDHITGKKSYGNVYVLMSVFILTVYAYIEILQTWLKVLQETRRR